MGPKPNLILVHSFATDSILLRGLTDFLDQYFHVYFIDLPGFIKQVQPIPEPSINNYAKYVAKKIEELNLPNYLIGGISLGFLIVNKTKLAKNCRGILAIEPYLGEHFLKLSRIKLLLFTGLILIIVKSNLANLIWNLLNVIAKLLRVKDYRIRIALEEIDPKTFFEVAEEALFAQTETNFHNLPHVLLINDQDRSIKYYQTIRLFKEKVRKLLILNIPVDHYPKDLSEEYFQSKLSDSLLKRLIIWIKKQS